MGSFIAGSVIFLGGAVACIHFLGPNLVGALGSAVCLFVGAAIAK